MIKRDIKPYVFGLTPFLISGLSSCTVGGPAPPPPLIGPNPFIDRLLAFVRYFSPLIILVLTISLVALGIYLITIKNSAFHRMRKYSPEEIAQMRYASGELSREEYMKIIEDLNLTKRTSKDCDNTGGEE